MKNKEWPELIKKQEVLYIDATPDENYPLRILQVYRDNCDTRWATEADGNCENALFEMMNKHQKQRAKILDKAIKKLQNE